MSSSQSSPFQGEYRCSDCGHGQRLQACAEAIVSGTLQPDGEVTQDDVSQTILCESSIECIDHPAPGAVLERWFDGRWTRWRHCDYSTERGYRCLEGSLWYYDHRIDQCPACGGAGGFNDPVEEVAHV